MRWTDANLPKFIFPNSFFVIRGTQILTSTRLLSTESEDSGGIDEGLIFVGIAVGIFLVLLYLFGISIWTAKEKKFFALRLMVIPFLDLMTDLAYILSNKFESPGYFALAVIFLVFPNIMFVLKMILLGAVPQRYFMHVSDSHSGSVGVIWLAFFGSWLYLPFHFVVGMYLYHTKVLAIKLLWNHWFHMWTGRNDFDHDGDDVHMRTYYESLAAHLLTETAPQIAIQFFNNAAVGWTPVAYLSMLFSLLNLALGLSFPLSSAYSYLAGMGCPLPSVSFKYCDDSVCRSFADRLQGLYCFTPAGHLKCCAGSSKKYPGTKRDPCLASCFGSCKCWFSWEALMQCLRCCSSGCAAMTDKVTPAAAATQHSAAPSIGDDPLKEERSGYVTAFADEKEGDGERLEASGGGAEPRSYPGVKVHRGSIDLDNMRQQNGTVPLVSRSNDALVDIEEFSAEHQTAEEHPDIVNLRSGSALRASGISVNPNPEERSFGSPADYNQFIKWNSSTKR